MLSRNPFLFLPKTLWRILKIDAHGRLYVHESSSLPGVQDLLTLDSWKPLSDNLVDLPPAFADILLIEDRFSPTLPTKSLIKIMNSNGIIVFPKVLQKQFESELKNIGFIFDKEIGSKSFPQLVVFKKDVIPCCGY